MQKEISALYVDHEQEIAEMRIDIEIREAQLEHFGIDFDLNSQASFGTIKKGSFFGLSDFSGPIFDENPSKTNLKNSGKTGKTQSFGKSKDKPRKSKQRTTKSHKEDKTTEKKV